MTSIENPGQLARSAEELWQQCNQVYFATIPPGHELENILAASAANPAPDQFEPDCAPEAVVYLNEGTPHNQARRLAL